MTYCLVVGSRSFDDYDLLSKELDQLRNNDPDFCIVSGGARGADSLAERYANEHDLDLKVFPANWDKHGRSAGYIRNAEMHEFIASFENRICVAFWDGISKGTAHNFGLTKKYNTPLKIIRF